MPLLLASNPYSTFIPPLAQFTPAASAVVFTNELNPFVPLVPFVPFAPFVPLVPLKDKNGRNEIYRKEGFKMP